MEKELDFDELHQAVNALMDQETKSKSKKAPAADRTPGDDTPSSAVPAATVPPKQDDDAVKVDVKRPLPRLTTHRGTRGRAMDVVGPKPAAKTTPPSAQTKRLAPTLQPTKAVTPEVPSPAEEKPNPQHKTEEPADDVLASLDMKDEAKPAESLLSHSEWPDPLDVHGFKDEDATPAPKEAKTVAKVEDDPLLRDDKQNAPAAQPTQTQPDKSTNDTAVSAPDALPSDQKEQKNEEPQDELSENSLDSSGTPFLTTKVEKRPLGAFAASTLEKPAPAPAPEPDKPATANVQQPKELSPEVVAVESAEPEFRPTVPPAVEHKQGDMHELRQMAIPQQYHTDDKEADTAARPVFDTKEYHPAIEAHSSKPTHHGVGWIILLIFALVLLGALVAVYYIMTGSFDFTSLL